MKNTLVILGSHPRGMKTFDFDRSDCDLWVFNEALKKGNWIKRADMVFQMHLEAIWRNPKNRNDPEHYAWLKSGQTPVIMMQDVYPDVPMSEKYPLDEIVQKYLDSFEWITQNKTDNKYFSSTLCFALALGIYRGYETIEVHGVEMETDTEYRYQRDGVTFWLGIALGSGVKVQAYTSIFDFPLYGYEGEAALDLADIEKRAAELEPLLEEKKQVYLKTADVSEAAVIKTLKDNAEHQNVIATLREQVKAMHELNRIGGALQENQRYKEKAVEMIGSAGAFQFSRQEFEMAARDVSQKHQKTVQEYQLLSGVCADLFNRVNVKNRVRRKHAFEKFATVARQWIEKAGMVGLYQGIIEENARYLGILDKFIKAAGGEKSEAVLLEAMQNA